MAVPDAGVVGGVGFEDGGEDPRAAAVRELQEETGQCADADGPQQVMARWTGDYRRGNERTARSHPRNRHRR